MCAEHFGLLIRCSSLEQAVFQYFEVLFAFASANIHDNGVLIFAHAAHPEVSRSIHNWAHMEEFYIAKDWFRMNDLDLQSPINPSELVFFSAFIHFHY